MPETRVTVTDVDMAFTAMVRFLLKWTAAAFATGALIGSFSAAVYVVYLSVSFERALAPRQAESAVVPPVERIVTPPVDPGAAVIEEAKQYLDSIGVK